MPAEGEGEGECVARGEGEGGGGESASAARVALAALGEGVGGRVVSPEAGGEAEPARWGVGVPVGEGARVPEAMAEGVAVACSSSDCEAAGEAEAARQAEALGEGRDEGESVRLGLPVASIELLLPAAKEGLASRLTPEPALVVGSAVAEDNAVAAAEALALPLLLPGAEAVPPCADPAVLLLSAVTVALAQGRAVSEPWRGPLAVGVAVPASGLTLLPCCSEGV